MDNPFKLKWSLKHVRFWLGATLAGLNMPVSADVGGPE